MEKLSICQPVDFPLSIFARCDQVFLQAQPERQTVMINTRFTPRAALKALMAAPITNLFGASRISGNRFEGKHFQDRGDVEYLQLLDVAGRMFGPDPEFENLSMLYRPEWNGLVEGPTWDTWWIQNSYGTSYCALPFLQEPFLTFLQNSQDLWFNQIGDMKTH